MVSGMRSIFLIFWVKFLSCRGEDNNSPLNGKHLRVMAMQYSPDLKTVRNGTNHIIHIEGVLFQQLVLLSKMFNFSYELQAINLFEAGTEDPYGKSIQHLVEDKTDYILSHMVGSISDLENKFDFPANWKTGQFGCLIPYPREQVNLVAPLKTFSLEVWISVVASTLAIVIFLFFLSNKNLRRSIIRFKESPLLGESSEENHSITRITYFVLGNLISQGQNLYSNRLAVRMAAGAWCVGCLFLVPAYCCTLTSHLLSPNQKPIAETFKDMAINPDITFAAIKYLALHGIIRSNPTGSLKLLGDKLNKNPKKYLCENPYDCLALVKTEKCAFCSPVSHLELFTLADMKSSGSYRCQVLMMKEKFLSTPVYTPLQKKSPYTEYISRGILKLKQIGFYEKESYNDMPSTSQCTSLDRKDLNSLKSLSMSNLSSAFLILLIGYLFSVLVFFCEKLNVHFRPV